MHSSSNDLTIIIAISLQDLEQVLKRKKHLFFHYSSLRNRVSKILHLNVGFILKLTVLYFIGITKRNSVFEQSLKEENFLY
ncbi:hypothetical protein BUQ74_13875 [Leptospira weilii serovar Heyan]|nr:hypothetical protein BUQ74_13875 [Leptospira weilii serovar Heyan]